MTTTPISSSLTTLSQPVTEAATSRVSSLAVGAVVITGVAVAAREAYKFYHSGPFLGGGQLWNLSASLPEHVTFMTDFLTGSKKETTKEELRKEINQGKNLIFIPVVLESPFRGYLPKGITPDHLVMICIDKEKQQVEYFDPQGGDPKNETRRVTEFEGKSLQELLSTCNSFDREVVHNPIQLQQDHTSCGYFGAFFMFERLSNDFNSIIHSTTMNASHARSTINQKLSNST